MKSALLPCGDDTGDTSGASVEAAVAPFVEAVAVGGGGVCSDGVFVFSSFFCEDGDEVLPSSVGGKAAEVDDAASGADGVMPGMSKQNFRLLSMRRNCDMSSSAMSPSWYFNS